MPVGSIGCRNAVVADSLEGSKTAFQASLMFNWFRSYLSFTDGTRPVLTQEAVAAEISWYFANRRSFGIGAGTVTGGQFSYSGTSIGLKPGPVLSFKGAGVLLKEFRYTPFVVGAVSVSMAWMPTNTPADRHDSFFASDVRLSLTAGYTVMRRLQLYLAPKVFGGPIFHFTKGNVARGNDRYFFQAGMGMTAILPGEFMLFVNGSPLGEQMLGGGVAKIF